MIDDNALKCVSSLLNLLIRSLLLIGAKAMQSCFPVSGPTSHLKNDQVNRLFFFFFFFFFFGTKVERKWCTNSKMHRGG